MTEYNKIARGSFTSTGLAQVVNLPFQPDWIEIFNYTASATPAQHGIPKAVWSASMGSGYAIVDLFNATPVLTTDVVTSAGFSTFSSGNILQYGGAQAVSTITKASPAVVTSSSDHGLKSGDVVIFSNLAQTASTGMQQICGIPFTVTVTGATTFTIPWNTNQSAYTAYDSGTATSAATFKKVLYPNLFAPGVNVISAITLGSTTTVDTTSAHNFYVGQEVCFHIPTAWGTTELNALPNSTIPGSPIYGYVVAVTDYNTVVVNMSSTGYTAFNSNQAVSSVPGLQYAQIAAVGDINTGGVQISAGSQLYPPLFVRPIGTTTVNTINGPAIQGAFFNNSSQGFIVGAGAGASDSSSVLVGASGDVIYWKASYSDISV